MANNFFAAISLTGGGTGALDAIDGTLLVDGDAAIVQTDTTVYFYHLDATSGAAESSPDVIEPDTNGGDKRWIKVAISGAGALPDYIRIVDEKASGTDGGTFTQDAWQKRGNLTESDDDGGHASIASDVITLAAGTYRYEIRCTAYDVLRHQARFRNTSDGATVHVGTSEYCNTTGNVQSHSEIGGEFTIASAKNFEIQHYCTSTKAGNGYGLNSANGENSLYVLAEFFKID